MRIYSDSLLVQAATIGDLSLLEACLDAGITIETKADDGSTALHCAARAGQTAAAQYLLEKGALFEVNGRSPLHEAILSSNAETVELLLQHLSKTTLLADVPNLEKCLAQSGNPDIVQLYIDHLDAANELRDAPQRILAAASHLGKLSIVVTLLQRADVNVNNFKEGIAPIHSAVRNGHAELLKILLSHKGIDVNLKTRMKYKMTAIYIAASKGKSEIVSLLLSQLSIDVNASSRYMECTPLYIAAKKGHIDVVRQLVAHNAVALNCLNKKRQTPLHVAARCGHLDVTRLLLDGSNIDTQCQDGLKLTALHLAAFGGHWQIVQLLLEHPEHSGNDHCTRDPSSRPDVTTNSDVVQRLLYHPDFWCGHISGDGVSRSSLLHGACERGDCDAIRVLLAYEGINVNLQDRWGQTPLILAVRNSHFEAVKLLLQHDGIDINQKPGYSNRAALKWAKVHRDQDMVDILLSHGAIDDESNPPTTTQHVTNAPIATTPNNAPETVPSLQPEPLWDDFMNDSLIEEWERSLDTELGILEADERI
jgi:ankyrin repeat protein